MPYAIIRTGGHQEKVTPGEQITVDHMKEEVGAEVRFAPLAVSKDDGGLLSDKSHLEGAAVVGKILKHFKGEKVESFQYRHKTGYRRHTGHRQPLTLVEISSIEVAGESFTYTAPVAPEAGTEPAAPAATAKPKADAKPSKAAARKAPTKSVRKGPGTKVKQAAAKKPAAKKSAKSAKSSKSAKKK